MITKLIKELELIKLNKTWEESESKVKDNIKDQIGIDEELKIGQNWQKENQKTILFKLESWKQKERVLKNTNKLKNTELYVNEHFSG